jgi:replicative DNA helicase
MSTPPHNNVAERAVLGAVILDPKVWGIVSPLIKGVDFYEPAHEKIWVAVESLKTLGRPVDASTVVDQLTRTKEITLAGGAPHILELISGAVVTANADYHAGIIRDLSARRRLINEAQRNLQDAQTSTDPVEAVLDRAEERLRAVPTNVPEYTGTVMSFDEFCDQPIPDNDWIIPGLLNRGDRLILTGTEGAGKTILMRQFAMCVAAGVHPFTYEDMPAQVALFVDAENPTSIMVKSFSGMRDSMRRQGRPLDEKNLWIERAPAGLNLALPSDRLWLQRLVSLINPDLLLVGPAYKLYAGGSKDSDEDLARQVTSALDSIRESVNCALILEHHAGHGAADGKERPVRPFGSSLWLRWPEFGYGIRAAKDARRGERRVDFVPWRGARDERDWPDQLVAGTNFMPWVDSEYA